MSYVFGLTHRINFDATNQDRKYRRRNRVINELDKFTFGQVNAVKSGGALQVVKICMEITEGRSMLEIKVRESSAYMW